MHQHDMYRKEKHMAELNQYPEFKRILEMVTHSNPLQRKRIETFIRQQDDRYWAFAEQLSTRLNRTLLPDEEKRQRAASAYNGMCMDMLREQIRFRKTGTYRLENAVQARQLVYDRQEVMQDYIISLLLTYLFWQNHYAMLRFYIAHLEDVPHRHCLEVGAGHGLFTAELLQRYPDSDVTIVDISESSIAVARQMLSAFELPESRVRFLHEDYMEVSLEEQKFDFIIMGEVIEHVDDAGGFLKRAHGLLQPQGTLFLSTCANCPEIDHVYHFHTVHEIRRLVESAGFHIAHDVALPAEALPEEEWERELITVNYCAILDLKSSRTA